MPSLKDLRNRIASVKATQKITKAMQMVAAAKLRRAQTAAEAARPYAERMETVLANLASGISGGGPPPCCRAPARARRIFSSSPPPSAACAAASIPPSSRLAREKIQALQAEGKTVKILCVGRRAASSCKRQFENRSSKSSTCAPSGRSASTDADPHRQEGHRAGSKTGQFDVATLFYSRFRSVIAQIPTAQQLIPAQVGGAGAASPAPMNSSPARRKSSPPCCRATFPCRFSARCWKTPLRNRARA